MDAETRGIEALVDQLIATHLEASTGERGPMPELKALPEDERRGLGYGMANMLMNDPVVLRFENAQRMALEMGLEFYCTEPWHALAEKRAATAALALGAIGEGFGGVSYMDEVWPDSTLVLARLAMDAPAFLWHDEPFHLALDAPLPKHVIADDVMQQPLMFFSYEKSLGLKNHMGQNIPNRVNWMMLARGGIGLLVIHDSFPPGSQQPDSKLMIESFVVPYRIEYPIAEGNPGRLSMANEVVGGVLRQLAFLKAPFVAPKRERMPRELRREIKRHQKDLAPASEEPTVSVVVLRRPVRPRDHAHDGGGGHKRRHWVKGHYRAQWYPSKGAHEVIYIEPHIRGSGGMVEHVYDVRQ